MELEEVSLLACFYYVDLEERKKLATSECKLRKPAMTRQRGKRSFR